MTTPDRIACPECNGKRVIATTQPHMHKYGGVEYRDAKTPDVERLHVCPTCDYLGTIAAEQAHIDADRAAFEATRPDFLALSHERVAAGDSPF